MHQETVALNHRALISLWNSGSLCVFVFLNPFNRDAEVCGGIQGSPGEGTSHATDALDGIAAPRCIVGNKADGKDGEEGWGLITGSGVSEEIEWN